MSYKKKDHYFHKAKQENFRARSVYKLQEIDLKHHLLKKGDRVLDLGCAPGSWSQYALSKVGTKGTVVGVDLSELRDLKNDNFTFIKGNLLENSTCNVLSELAPFNCLISDMAPSTSGIKIVDQARSLELCQAAAQLAERFLIEGGSFLCKLFYGTDSQEFIRDLKKSFKEVVIIKPQATRKISQEIFLLARSFHKSEV